MMRAKKHWGLSKGAVFAFLLLAAIATPISLSLAAPSLATPNIAYAAVCPAGFQDMPLPNGTVACKGTPGAEMPLGGTTPTGMYVTLGDQDVAINANGETLDRNGQVINSDTGQAVNAGAPAVCTGIVSCLMWLPTALWKVIVTLLAGSLIYISTWILAAAASLFNWLVDNTIIQFGAFYGTIKPAVETAWTAFRDIANIFIIGIFTFVAISIILGLKEFGQKKMIASVLIVAVLINFSLLFTKMIIDVSNFAAAQVYTAAALGGSTAGQGAPIGSASTVPKYGIADQFMYLLGVGTFSDAYKIVNDTAQAKDSGWAALLHGILVFAVVIGAALVLFYGSFLLVSRMIMLIFLMATAAIAVASYLIPDWGTSNYGFKAWKSSLIWCATLAPMLMVFLWMTLNVSYALKGTPKATLGAALSNPAGGENIVALFNYVLVLGLLFTTFKLSSMWANKIGGFSFASMVPGIGVGIGGIVGGFLTRNSLGWGARLARDTMKARGWTGKAGNEGLMGAARRQSQILATRLANRTARTNFNPLQAKTLGIGGKIASTLSVPKMLTGKDVGGSYEDVMKRKAAKADELARQIGPSDAQHRDSAEREARLRYREQRTQLNTLIGQQEQMTNTVRQRQNDRPEAEDALRTAKDALKTEERAQTAAAEKHASDHRIAEQQEGNGLVPAGTAANLRAARATEMQAEKQRISNAQAEVARHAQVLTEMDADAQRILARDSHFNELTTSIADNTKALERLGRSEDDAAAKARKDGVRTGTVNLAKKLLWDKRAGYKVEGAAKEHEAAENWRHIQSAFRNERQAQAPATPTAPNDHE